jgi:hypothetical protein
LRQSPFDKKLQTQIVSTSRLRKKLLYKKAACKMLVKLTPGGSMCPRYVLQLLFSVKQQNWQLLQNQQQ